MYQRDGVRASEGAKVGLDKVVLAWEAHDGCDLDPGIKRGDLVRILEANFVG